MIQYDHMMTAEVEFSSSNDTRETEDAIQSNSVAGKQENRQITFRYNEKNQGIWTRDNCSSVFVDSAFV